MHFCQDTENEHKRDGHRTARTNKSRREICENFRRPFSESLKKSVQVYLSSVKY